MMGKPPQAGWCRIILEAAAAGVMTFAVMWMLNYFMP